ncbi:hypothetical protein A9Q98_09195 [Thalassotalea sp. 42_200_T64]|nr:hypothetical protein A9Q98_09195 [Thalassotalea sp. 42_200_T64]
MNYLDLDDGSSVNISVTGGYDFYQRQLLSANIQALTLAAEAQYADSISGTDNIVNYSLFLAARMYTSERLFFKAKSGITNFPDVVLKNDDAEHSHFDLGVGLGYKLYSTTLELEYIYANKTLHASIVEISVKYHF